MKLAEACHFLEELELIPVAILDHPDVVRTYCQKYYFHPLQEYLIPERVQDLIDQISPEEVVHITDPFQVHFLYTLVRRDESYIPLVYGPYKTELLNSEEIRYLLGRLHISDLSGDSLAEYRGHFQIKSQGAAQYTLSVLLSHFSTVESFPRLRRIDQSLNHNIQEVAESEASEIHAALIRARYENEEKFIQAIAAGNRKDAIATWQVLHQSVEHRKLGRTLEISRISAAVTRTMIRIGAIRAGLPAEINDHLSRESSLNINRARDIDAIMREHERLIVSYCKAIHTYKTSQYSSTVMSALYMIDTMYDQELSTSQIAAEIGVSESHLIHAFRREKNMTPSSYINQVRMANAASLLSTTGERIQVISEKCGIGDANYFVKCFRKEYGMTPSQYRSRFRK